MEAGKGRGSGRRKDAAMNERLGWNVRTMREIKHWTQQHLADTAGIQLRTVQRVEKGEGASVETLGALANAFEISIDMLQADYATMADQVQKQQEEFQKAHEVIPLAPVNSSADLNVMADAQASQFHCFPEGDVIQDAFAALQANVRDMVDIWDDVDPVSHRDWIRSAFAQIEELRKRGAIVGVGRGQRTWRGVRFKVLYVVAMPQDDVREFIAVERAS